MLQFPWKYCWITHLPRIKKASKLKAQKLKTADYSWVDYKYLSLEKIKKLNWIMYFIQNEYISLIKEKNTLMQAKYKSHDALTLLSRFPSFIVLLFSSSKSKITFFSSIILFKNVRNSTTVDCWKIAGKFKIDFTSPPITRRRPE